MRRRNARKWDADTTAHFVTLYKQHECLWNPLSEHYKFKRAREFAVDAMKNDMNIDGLGPREVRDKIRSLRSTYIQEKRKVDKNGEKSNLIWYDVMDEIMTKIQNKEPASETSKTELLANDESSDNDEATETELDETLQTDRLSDSVPNSKSNHEQKRSKKRDCIQVENSPDEMESPRRFKPKRCHSRSDRQSDGAEFDIFGESVAAQLKKLTIIQALIAQHQIQSILSRCRINDIKGLQSDLISRENNKKNKRKHRRNHKESDIIILDRHSKRNRLVNHTENEIDIDNSLMEDPLPSGDTKEDTRRQIHNLFCEKNPISDDE